MKGEKNALEADSDNFPGDKRRPVLGQWQLVGMK